MTATQWLQTRRPALGGHTPLELAQTEVGGEAGPDADRPVGARDDRLRSVSAWLVSRLKFTEPPHNPFDGEVARLYGGR